MVKLIIELLEFLRSCAPLLFSVAVLTLFFVLLSKSIKKHATAYYIIFSIPFLLVVIPFICRLFGVEAFSLNGIPVLGGIIRDYIHMAEFGHPLLIIIMYMGALDGKVPGVNKLMSIRKEISIISGFPILTHSLIRVVNNFPGALKFFTNNADYMANTRVTSELGAGLTSFSFVLGVIMLAIFLPLWITSFDAVHKKMGSVRWKKFQKWSYVLYATLFIHAMGIQVGFMLNPRGGHAQRPAVVATATTQEQAQEKRVAPTVSILEQGEGRANPQGDNAGRAEGSRNRPQAEQGSAPENRKTPAGSNVAETNKAQKQPAGNQGNNRHGRSKSLSDFQVSAGVKQYIHLFSLILIYGSYLYLRIWKAKRQSKRTARPAAN